MLDYLMSWAFIVTPVLLTKGKHMSDTLLAKAITIAVMLVLGVMIGIAWS